MNGERVLSLKCSVHNNEWGKMGKESAVGRLELSTGSHIEEDKPYAELWMGTHCKGPSYVVKNGKNEELLSEWIIRNPKSLGSCARTCVSGNLRFLLKVLSVRKSLAMQIHPNKIQAEKLHKERPQIYADPNPKPEMAIAITPFKAMVGFRPASDIVQFIENIEPFKIIVGIENANQLIAACKGNDLGMQKRILKNCFRALMTEKEKVIERETSRLLQLIENQDRQRNDMDNFHLHDVVYKLNTEYPGDRGIFMPFFFNIIDLETGEAVFIDANIPHAYLSGDCIECMSCSHNVVRAALTHKYRDVKTFCSMVDYTGRTVDDLKLRPFEINRPQLGVKETIFRPPTPDFAVCVIEVTTALKRLSLKSMDTASICLVYEGEGHASSLTLQSALKLNPGTALFISAKEEVIIKTASKSMLLFRALGDSCWV